MLETILQGLGSASFFAARAFVPAFVTALLMRLGPSLPWISDTELVQALPDGVPHWFASTPSLLVLGLLAGAEMFSDKSSELRLALDEFGKWVKPIMAALTVLGLMGALDVDFAEQVLEGEVKPKNGSMGDGVLATVTGAFTWVLASLRGAILGLFREGDEDDDAGVQGLLSWAEDLWAAFGPLLLVLFPIMMAALVGLVTLMLYGLRKRAEAKEDASRVPCSSCGQPVYRCAVRCGACQHPVDAPRDVGFFGTTIDRAVPDAARQPYRLAEKKRCPVCATRLPERVPRQRCPACAHELFSDPEFLERYLADVKARLPFALLLCAVLSLVPVAGLLPGVIYYRVALVAPFRRYLPTGKALVLKWGVRILFLVLVAIQWIPAVGGIVVPTMALVNYFAWRAVFESVAREEPDAAPAPA